MIPKKLRNIKTGELFKYSGVLYRKGDTISLNEVICRSFFANHTVSFEADIYVIPHFPQGMNIKC